MRPTSDLQDLQRAGLARTARLHAYMSSVLIHSATLRPVPVDSAVAFVIIELDNLWAGMARSFFLSTAFCARDGWGGRIQLSKVPKARSKDEALTYAIRRCRKTKYMSGLNGPWQWFDEPYWWKPHTLLETLDEIGASNYQQVSAAMSAAPSAFAHLHRFRNFYAHRNRGTRSMILGDLRHFQFPTTYTATRALTSPMVGQGTVRPQPLIFDWLDDIWNTISLLV